MRPSHIVTLLALATLQACAQPPTQPLFAKTDWTVSAVSCPAGCSALTRDFLQKQLGQHITLDDNHFDAPFVDRCAGSLRYLPRQQPVADVLAELRRAAPPNAKPLTPASLGVAGDARLTTATALCREAAGEMSYQRLLAIEPGRVLVLFEEQSVIELR
ncbi:hypothetical protein ACG04R_02400 [Roseateles sp. BYS78W]|uniref:Lipoprotein n=1 Tax=Pelomonas candidula TaxID=3299025 RepID=A0ABW7H6H3_9BURK